MKYTEDDVTFQLVEWVRNEADLDDLAAMYSEHTADKDDPVVIVVRSPKGPESFPYVNGAVVDRTVAAAPELLAALKDLAYTTEAMSAYIPPQNAKIREEYVTRTHRAWQCIRKAERGGE